jgi:hypothetical protein
MKKNKRRSEWGKGWDGKSRIPDKTYKENYDQIDWSSVKTKEEEKEMKWLILIMLLLTGCLGPELFTLGGIKVTAGTAITVPHKIEAYEKYKEQK